jgi:hypothetical protein
MGGVGSQCSLGENVQNGRSILKVTADGKDCVIASLISDKMEHCVMELMFEEGTYVFSVSGKNEIHVAGNMMDSDDGDMGHDHDDEDEDEDEDEDDQPQRVNLGKGRAQPPSEDDDDDDDDEVRGARERTPILDRLRVHAAFSRAYFLLCVVSITACM